MNAPLSRFLAEFSTPVSESLAFADLELDAEDVIPVPALPTDEFQHRIDEARREATDAARAALETELKIAFDAERAALLRGFEEEREVWAKQQGESLSTNLTAALLELEKSLSDALSAALRPLLVEASRTRVLAELETAVQALLGDPGHPAIRIEGPLDLLTAFGNAHPGELAIDYVVADQTELTIIAEGTRIATRLSECVARLSISEG